MKEGSKITESSAFLSSQKGEKEDGLFLKPSQFLAFFIAVLVLGGCRGQEFEQQPVHPNMNMDQQERFEGQEQNPFFADNRSMRQPVEGTVSRGNLREDHVFYQGIDEDSSFVTEIPVEVNKSFLNRGKDQYDVYCTPCHGILGDGEGIVMTGGYGYVPAPTFHGDRLRDVEDGYLYSVIANGIRNMPAYAHQIKVKDRWAIVAYIRALQRSQFVPEEDMEEYDVDLASLQAEAADQQEQQAAQEEAAGDGGEVSAERGEELFAANGCQACHSLDGSDNIGPSLQGVMDRTESLDDGTTITVDEEYLRESIVNPSARIVEGYNPVMAPYSHLSDSEIDSIIEYLKSL